MRFVHLPYKSASPEHSGTPNRELANEYRAGHRVGVLTLGTCHLFFRRRLTLYALPYAQISRYFRRVLAVPARIGCCTGGELRIEHLVICCADASGEREVAQIQLPGERAAKAVMEELRALAPGAASGRPQQQENVPQALPVKEAAP